MMRRVFVLLGAAAVAALGAACKGNPLSDKGGSPQRVDLQFSTLEVVIGDSIRTFAIERDAINTPLPPTATVRSCDPSIATVVTVSDAPQLRTGFYVKGVSFGSTCVIVEAHGLADTMQVSTFPATIVVTGPDSIPSGQVTTFGYQYRDRAGNILSGLPAPVFSSSDSNRGKVVTTPFGGVQGRAPGLVTLTVTGIGSPNTGIKGTKLITIVPGVFTGTVSPTSAGAGDVITITRGAADPIFDADVQVSFGNNVGTFVDSLKTTPDQIKVIVPGLGKTGATTFVITGMGPTAVALKGDYTISRADYLDPNDPASDAPGTAPSLTTSGDYFGLLSGTCADGSVTDPADDCDDFYAVTAGATAVTVVVRLDWTQAANVDVDMIWCKVAACSPNSNLVLGGATGNKPENVTVTIPAGATWYLWFNFFDPKGTTHVVWRARVSGLP